MNEIIKAGADINAGDGGYSIGTEEKYNEFAKGRNQSMGKMRIKELALQSANEIADLFSTGFFDDRMINDVAEINKKFAELIVQECIDKIETHRIPVGNSAAGEMACEWTYAALKEIRDEIKQHFGVEE